MQPQQKFFLCAGMLSCRVTGWGKADQTLFYRLYISMCPDGLLSSIPLFHKESRVFFTCCHQNRRKTTLCMLSSVHYQYKLSSGSTSVRYAEYMHIAHASHLFSVFRNYRYIGTRVSTIHKRVYFKADGTIIK